MQGGAVMKHSYMIVIGVSADDNIIGLKEEIAARLEGLCGVRIISVEEEKDND